MERRSLGQPETADLKRGHPRVCRLGWIEVDADGHTLRRVALAAVAEAADAAVTASQAHDRPDTLASCDEQWASR
jgi:hypothetical protein